MNADTRLKISVVGPFRVTSETGEDLTPKGKKACAVLAMLALSPDRRRLRRWVQDKLWSDRANEQGSASLRQSLSEIRKALRDRRDLLRADSMFVSLDAAAIALDLDIEAKPLTVPSAALTCELLEGLDVRDEEFEDWLREQRAWFEANRDETPNAKPRQKEHSRQTLILAASSKRMPRNQSIIADCLIDSLSKTLSEIGQIDIIDQRGAAAPTELLASGLIAHQGLRVHSDSITHDQKTLVRLQLTSSDRNQVVWTDTIRLGSDVAATIDDASALEQVNYAVYAAMEELLGTRELTAEEPVASMHCYNGIKQFFQLGAANFKSADQSFARAYELDQRGIYLAWRAFLRTFQLAERQFECRQTLVDETFEFIGKAMEHDAKNSFVLAIAAQVQYLMRRSYVAAIEFAEQSLRINPANPLAWALSGTATSHMGDPEKGYAQTKRARALAAAAPFRFQIDSICCVAATMAGRFDDAIRFGEVSHAAASNFAPPLRYLSALYHYKRQHELSFDMMKKMRTIEPDFSYNKLLDKSYPAASLRRSELFSTLSQA